MRTSLYISVCLSLFANQVRAQQQPDSVHATQADSANIQAFNATVGPAEAVFSFSPMQMPFRFASGVYVVSNSAFPLLDSPDSLVRQPIERAYRQRRRARISSIVTAVPLVIFAYSATRIVFAFGSVATGRLSSAGVPTIDVLRVSGVAAVAGITVTGAFNIASTINLYKGIKRHNRWFGRKPSTFFNPKGL